MGLFRPARRGCAAAASVKITGNQPISLWRCGATFAASADRTSSGNFAFVQIVNADWVIKYAGGEEETMMPAWERRQYLGGLLRAVSYCRKPASQDCLRSQSLSEKTGSSGNYYLPEGVNKLIL